MYLKFKIYELFKLTIFIILSIMIILIGHSPLQQCAYRHVLSITIRWGP